MPPIVMTYLLVTALAVSGAWAGQCRHPGGAEDADRATGACAVVPADGQLRPARDLRARPARARGVRMHVDQPVHRVRLDVPVVPRRFAHGRRLATAGSAQRQLGRRHREHDRGQAGDRHAGFAARVFIADRRAVLLDVGGGAVFGGAAGAGIQSLDACTLQRRPAHRGRTAERCDDAGPRADLARARLAGRGRVRAGWRRRCRRRA